MLLLCGFYLCHCCSTTNRQVICPLKRIQRRGPPTPHYRI
ncbi:unnamed protein product [Musa acuminata subsp. malaccensis]|uniref:(wild Malaysian banana) hypothetical protein n=1 Tax=Musa acuminata subsp. malaccensis TaxID=214687 RepID=A0A804JVR8_MUSAM|nr:unnamed protein product [Musa acuminata subsp. malaccensis]